MVAIGSSSDFVNSYIDRSEKLLDTLASAKAINFKEMEDLLHYVQMSFAHKEKAFTRTLSQMHDKSREYHINQAVGRMRGWEVAGLTAFGSGLQMAAGVSSLAPHAMMGGVAKLNEWGGTYKPFQAFLDAQVGRSHGEIAGIFTNVFSNAGQATNGLSGIANQRQNSYQMEHNSRSEGDKLNKERLNQEVQQIGQRFEDVKRKQSDSNRAHHEMLMALMRV